MQTFPVEYSSLSTAALCQFIIEQYGLEPSTSMVFLKRGFNDTYSIESNKDKYICRVYKHSWRALESIKSELDLLVYLKQNNVSVSFPIQDLKGERIHEINAPEGIRYLVLFSHARGQRVRKLTIDQAFLLGAETAKLHLLTAEKKIPTAQNYDISVQFEEIVRVGVLVLKNYPKQLQLLLQMKQKFLKEFEIIDKEELKQGICHGDLQAENFHIDEANQLTFFDFDFFGHGYLIYDIGVFTWYDHKNKPPEIRNAFFKGYESKRRLTETERRLIPWFSTLRALFQMTLYCKISDGKQLPLWPSVEVSAFIDKVEKWNKEQGVGNQN